MSESFRLFKMTPALRDDPESCDLVRLYDDCTIWSVILTGTGEIWSNGYGDIDDADADFPITNNAEYVSYLLWSEYEEIEPHLYADKFVE